MDQIKLENFRKEYGFEIPIVRSLPAGECIKIRENLLYKFSLNDIDEFFKIDKFNKFDGFNADEEFDDLFKFFSDIWYPSLDDIEIFDINLNWIISVRHYGDIYYFLTKK